MPYTHENIHLRKTKKRRVGTVYYEFRPYVFLWIGLYSITLNYIGFAGKVAAFTLISCAIGVIYTRFKSRGIIS